MLLIPFMNHIVTDADWMIVFIENVTQFTKGPPFNDNYARICIRHNAGLLFELLALLVKHY
ncbi:MAG: hypothetical protein BAJATHORv1_20355 [Candidatus Thorarchaeota archaeon]|nr:MAG: hypothetical protein BAJATHORv1_20355 [Candidatus Thorarchaeota archaeon]